MRVPRKIERLGQEASRLESTIDTVRGVEHGLFQLVTVGIPPDEDGSADRLHVLSAARTEGARARSA